MHFASELRGPAPIASEALERIAALYAIEKDICRCSPYERRAARQEKSGPILAEPEPWLREKLALISQKTKLAEAIRYALSRRKPILIRAAWPVANIYPASPDRLGAPKWGIRSHTPLQVVGLGGLDNTQAPLRAGPTYAVHFSVVSQLWAGLQQAAR